MTSVDRERSPVSASIAPPKQIRFVNNEGQPPTKRRRINAACRTCRKRKTRCDGKRPYCTTCAENGHQCMGYAETGTPNRPTPRVSNTPRNDDGHDEETAVRDGGSHIFSPRPIKAESLSIASPHPGRESDVTAFDQRHLDVKRDPRDMSVFDDALSSPMRQSSPLPADSRRIPYFRYFGPTAIVPGFKQMVVTLRERRRSMGAASATPEIPVYDPADPSPIHHLIIYLIEIFFSHLGCNYPFLKREKFLRLVQQKRAEPILVDAVCALASRFSDHALLPHYGLNKARSEHGHNFAQRAKSGVVDTFPCPTVAAVQACLLLAYEGFGDAQDSALWMFLGCSIRMLLDLGIHKIDGVKHRSHGMGFGKSSRQGSSTEAGDDTKRPSIMDDREKMEIEQEQVDTLWAVFMLDRVISSGTGRPVSLRDEDFELEFPDTASIMPNGWPAPFPALIRVIHLYGKITDVINSIRDVKGFQEQMKSLSAVESALTKLYQRLDARLNFSAPNFQHYVKSGQGTTFLLLHLWFHAGIMLLHQPTLLHSFEGQIQQLLPNSRELSMSSAKTISDILAFAEVIDGKSLQGNPFTSQPCYIAACAFLMEISSHTSSHPSSNASHPSSGASSPPRKHAAVDPATQDPRAATGSIRHSLLASAANQNYQRCYKALQQLETYWAGAKYIITALDQKAKGIWDPETFTQEEMEATKLPKPELPQGWNRRSSLALQTSLPRNWSAGQSPRLNDLGSPPMIDPAQAIGFSLTGTTNSPSSNLTFLYQPNTGEPPPPPARQSTPSGTMIYDPIRQSLPEAPRHAPFTSSVPSGYSPSYATHGHPRPSLQQMLPPPSKYHPLATDPASRHDAEMLLGLQTSPYSTSLSPRTAYEAAPSPDNPGEQQRHDPSLPPFPYSHSPVAGLQFQNNPNSNANYNMGSSVGTQSMSGFGDMMMESQEIDMSALGGDMMPWLEYLPSDVMSFFENAGMGGGEAQAGGEMGDMGNGGSG